MTGRFQEAVSEGKEAVLLDPLAHIFRAALAGLLSLTGQNDRGVEQLKQIFAMDPQYPKAHEVLGGIYLSRGMYKEAIHEFQASEQYGGEKLLGELGYAYARSGKKDQALKTLAELQELEKRSGDASIDLTLVEIAAPAPCNHAKTFPSNLKPVFAIQTPRHYQPAKPRTRPPLLDFVFATAANRRKPRRSPWSSARRILRIPSSKNW